MRRLRSLDLLAALSAALLTIAAPSLAHAGGSDRRIAQLTRTVTSGRTDKERVAAVTALAGMSDRRALAPLVTALGDPSDLVRAVAASALGKLGAKAALPQLRVTAEDGNVTVRTKARDAYAKICKANGLVNDLADATPAPVAMTATTASTPTPADGKAGFGSRPRAVAARPSLYVVVKSSADDSAGSYDKRTRKLHADHVLASMTSALRADATITSAGDVARKYSLGVLQLDLSVTKLEQRTASGNIEVEAQLRLSITDDDDHMRAFVSGGAIVTVPKRTYKASSLPGLRREALEGAVAGLVPKLVAQLRRGVGS